MVRSTICLRTPSYRQQSRGPHDKQVATYTITYTASDKAGNVATATRKVQVKAACAEPEKFCPGSCSCSKYLVCPLGSGISGATTCPSGYAALNGCKILTTFNNSTPVGQPRNLGPTVLCHSYNSGHMSTHKGITMWPIQSKRATQNPALGIRVHEHVSANHVYAHECQAVGVEAV
jgi:hypothetical protein